MTIGTSVFFYQNSCNLSKMEPQCPSILSMSLMKKEELNSPNFCCKV